MDNVQSGNTMGDGTTTSKLVVATAIIDILKTEGVQFLSAYPTTPMIDASARRSLRPILCRQERTGVHIADGFSRLTNGSSPGVFAMQWGPGVENAYAGVATAFADSVPMLFLPMGYPAKQADALRFTSADRLSPIAKSVERIRNPNETEAVMRRAFSRMRNGRPGPVVVEVPTDIALEPTAGTGLRYKRATTSRSGTDSSAVDTATALILRAQRPVIITGQGVLYAEASAELIRFAELIDAPVATTLEGKSAFPETHALALGTGSMVMPQPLRDALVHADLIIGIGASLTDHPMAVKIPADKPIIHITNDYFDINKDYETVCPMLGDAQLVLGQLSRCVVEARPRGIRRGTAERLAQLRKQWLARWRPFLESHEVPINPYRVVSELNRTLDPDESVVTHDSGSPRDQITPFYRSTIPRSYIGWGKSHALGTGLGLIMGAKLAAPEKVCVNVMGDAAFGMVGLDLETAVRNEIPIVTVVLNNSTMAIETSMLRVSQQRYGARDIGGDYTNLAKAMGAWATRVTAPGQIAEALQQAVAVSKDGAPALIEVITSPEETPFSCRGGDNH